MVCHDFLDKAGFHAAHCKHFACHRHNAIAKHVARFTSVCGFLTNLEVSLNINANVSRNHAPRPGDILIEETTPPSKHFLDVSAVNPAAKTYRIKAATTPLFSSNLASTRKIQKYESLFARANSNSMIPHEFTPLVVETYGAWDKLALNFFRNLARRRLLSPGAATQSSSTILSHFLTSLDIALQSANAYAILTCGFPKTTSEVHSTPLA